MSGLKKSGSRTCGQDYTPAAPAAPADRAGIAAAAPGPSPGVTGAEGWAPATYRIMPFQKVYLVAFFKKNGDVGHR